MPDNSLLTVVIPVFNGEGFVARAVRSALAQTDRSIEVVVVDDGSSDATGAVVASLRDERVRLVRQPNRGVSAARNHGVRLARGSWVAFLDADDEWLPDHVEAFREGRRLLPSALLLGAGYRYEMQGRAWLPRIVLPPGSTAWIDLPDYFASAAAGSPPVCSSAAFAARDVFLEVGGFPERVSSGEDLLTWARLAHRGPVGVGRRVTSLLHLQHGELGGTTLRRLPTDLDRVARCFAELLESTRGPRRRSLRRYLQHFHLGAASQWLRVPRRGKALAEVGRAARLGVLPWKGFALAGLTLLPTRWVWRLFAHRRAS